MIDEYFGTWRGLVRLGLAHGQMWSGRSAILSPNPAQISRLVFVCHGNICRSAFADVLAKTLGLRSASFGLSTSSGQAAHEPASKAAIARGVDLSAHRTLRVEEFRPARGDLLLAMEVRQLHRLAATPALKEVPRSLLGLWAKPPIPHLHDPYQLDERYMKVCLARIQEAVINLATAFPGVKI